jgi:hypothetical protein
MLKQGDKLSSVDKTRQKKCYPLNGQGRHLCNSTLQSPSAVESLHLHPAAVLFLLAGHCLCVSLLSLFPRSSWGNDSHVLLLEFCYDFNTHRMASCRARQGRLGPGRRQIQYGQTVVVVVGSGTRTFVTGLQQVPTAPCPFLGSTSSSTVAKQC